MKRRRLLQVDIETTKQVLQNIVQIREMIGFDAGDGAEAAKTEAIKVLLPENERLEQWVKDLQSGMYVNCVYCGHRYGPDDKVPTSMADALKEHIEQCPKHPMSALKKEVERLAAYRKDMKAEPGEDRPFCPRCHEEIVGYYAQYCEHCGQAVDTSDDDDEEGTNPEPLFDEQKCRVCGCTQDHACEGGCYWVEEDLCSKCAETPEGKEVGPSDKN